MGFSVRRWRAFAIMAVTLIFGIHYFLNASRDFGLDEQPKPKPHSSHNKPPDDGKIHWKKLPESYPVDELTPLPKGKPVSIPTIQAKAKPEDAAAKVVRLKRLAAVKESFAHSWEGYKKHAWLRDEVIPVAGGYRDKFGGWAASLVDALDTLWIMGFKDEFEQAVNALHEIDFTTTDEQAINVFETTIRYLGGFLAAYDISGAKYPILLQKATEVGDFLMCAFDTPNRMPISRWPWKS
jgi:mannosyl-oligosaccharide alpha-1,2-mannosidase